MPGCTQKQASSLTLNSRLASLDPRWTGKVPELDRMRDSLLGPWGHGAGGSAHLWGRSLPPCSLVQPPISAVMPRALLGGRS